MQKKLQSKFTKSCELSLNGQVDRHSKFERLFQFELFEFLCLRHHVGRNLLETERARAMWTGASQTYTGLRSFPKIFNNVRNHELCIPTA